MILYRAQKSHSHSKPKHDTCNAVLLGSCFGGSLLLLLQFPLVESKLLALDQISIATTTLPRSRSNRRQEPALHKLIFNCNVQLLLSCPCSNLGKHMFALLH